MILIFFIFLILAALIFYYLFFSASSQFFGKTIYKVKTKEKILTLTFDDGPSQFTKEIADLLKKYQIKGTFFQIGKKIEKNTQLTRQLFQEGHIIGNHSYSHYFFSLFNLAYFEEEIKKTQEIIEKIIGKKPKFFRPPWLLRTPQMFQILQKYNLIVITGKFGSILETFNPSPKIMTLEILFKVRPGDILIFHERGKAVIKTLQIVIPELLNRGYKFSSLSELLGIDPYY